MGGAVDYYQWGSLLKSVSAFEAYRKIYRDVITPMRVAELFILRDDMPRSLHACLNEVEHELTVINGPAGREEVVDDQHPLSGRDRVTVDLERVGPVLEGVLDGERLGGLVGAGFATLPRSVVQISSCLSLLLSFSAFIPALASQPLDMMSSLNAS